MVKGSGKDEETMERRNYIKSIVQSIINNCTGIGLNYPTNA